MTSLHAESSCRRARLEAWPRLDVLTDDKRTKAAPDMLNEISAVSYPLWNAQTPLNSLLLSPVSAPPVWVR